MWLPTIGTYTLPQPWSINGRMLHMSRQPSAGHWQQRQRRGRRRPGPRTGSGTGKPSGQLPRKPGGTPWRTWPCCRSSGTRPSTKVCFSCSRACVRVRACFVFLDSRCVNDCFLLPTALLALLGWWHGLLACPLGVAGCCSCLDYTVLHHCWLAEGDLARHSVPCCASLYALPDHVLEPLHRKCSCVILARNMQHQAAKR